MIEDIPFVIYNNRSVEGVVMNFLASKKFNPFRLLQLERDFSLCDEFYREVRTIEITASDLDVGCVDVAYGPNELADCLDLVLCSIERLRRPKTHDEIMEATWLVNRGLRKPYENDKFGSLSYVVENATARQLEVLGITCHPMLGRILDDALTGGGIVIPLFEDGALVNVTTRRISDVGKLKYTQSCPDLSVWGLSELSKDHPVWMVEGLFDMHAINYTNRPFWSGPVRQAASVSSAMWSVPQLMQLLDSSGHFINIFADNDKVGLRTAAVMKMFLEMQGRTVGTYVSQLAKDPAEHFLECRLGWDAVVEINITDDMIQRRDDMSFNFMKYLKNRRF